MRNLIKLDVFSSFLDTFLGVKANTCICFNYFFLYKKNVSTLFLDERDWSVIGLIQGAVEKSRTNNEYVVFNHDQFTALIPCIF